MLSPNFISRCYRAPAGSRSSASARCARGQADHPLLAAGAQDGIDAVMPFKRQGSSAAGHKVRDNAKAFEALQRVAPQPYRDTLDTAELSLFQKSQLLNSVLRQRLVLDAEQQDHRRARGAAVSAVAITNASSLRRCARTCPTAPPRWCAAAGRSAYRNSRRVVRATVDVRRDATGTAGWNNYVSVGAVHADPVLGEYRRRKANLVRLLTVMVDDLGTKLPMHRVDGCHPQRWSRRRPAITRPSTS